MQIRRMEKKDAPAIYEIGINEKNLHGSEENDFWSVEELRNWIDSKDDMLLVASEDNKMVGFIMSAVHKPTSKVDIEYIWVHEDFRGTGLSKKLLDAIIKKFNEIGLLYVSALANNTNDRAVNFFENNGFKKGFSFYWMDKNL